MPACCIIGQFKKVGSSKLYNKNLKHLKISSIPFLEVDFFQNFLHLVENVHDSILNIKSFFKYIYLIFEYKFQNLRSSACTEYIFIIVQNSA